MDKATITKSEIRRRLAVLQNYGLSLHRMYEEPGESAEAVDREFERVHRQSAKLRAALQDAPV